MHNPRPAVSAIHWKWATIYNLIPYVIGNVGGTLIYILLSPGLMIVSTMTLFPLVYILFAFLYYRKSGLGGGRFFDREWKQLTAYWIALSVTLDTIFWMFLLPRFVFPQIFRDYQPHIAWDFFYRERSYIWANYLAIILITIAGKWVCRKTESTPLEQAFSLEKSTSKTFPRM